MQESEFEWMFDATLLVNAYRDQHRMRASAHNHRSRAWKDVPFDYERCTAAASQDAGPKAHNCLHTESIGDGWSYQSQGAAAKQCGSWRLFTRTYVDQESWSLTEKRPEPPRNADAPSRRLTRATAPVTRNIIGRHCDSRQVATLQIFCR